MRKRVVLVRQGSWGQTKQGDNDPIIKYLEEALKESTGQVPLSGTKDAEVEVIDTYEEVEGKVLSGSVDVVVFFSRGMQGKAHELLNSAANSHRRIQVPKVVVVSGLIPKNEVIWLDKSAVTQDEIVKAILSWSTGGEFGL